MVRRVGHRNKGSLLPLTRCEAMPTRLHSLIAIVASAAITVGGAWVASGMHANARRATSDGAVSAVLAVTVSGIRNTNGKIIVIVFDDRDAFKAFDVSKAVGYKALPAVMGRIVAQFTNLNRGPFAVAAFHDEDENQNLNMNGQIPSEGYATSGATDPSDMPTFRRASVSSGPVKIRMYYLE